MRILQWFNEALHLSVLKHFCVKIELKNCQFIILDQTSQPDGTASQPLEIDGQNPELKKSELTDSDVENSESNNPESKKSELSNANVENSESNNPDNKKSVLSNAKEEKSESTNAEKEKSESTNADVKKSELSNPSVNKSESDNAEVKKSKTNNAEEVSESRDEILEKEFAKIKDIPRHQEILQTFNCKPFCYVLGNIYKWRHAKRGEGDGYCDTKATGIEYKCGTGVSKNAQIFRDIFYEWSLTVFKY